MRIAKVVVLTSSFCGIRGLAGRVMRKVADRFTLDLKARQPNLAELSQIAGFKGSLVNNQQPPENNLQKKYTALAWVESVYKASGNSLFGVFVYTVSACFN